METEISGKLPFLDVLITMKSDGSLGHTVYRKPTHTDRYLNARSFHPPSVKASVNRTLIQRAHRLCDNQSLKQELSHINLVLRTNGTANTLQRRNHSQNQLEPMPRSPSYRMQARLITKSRKFLNKLTLRFSTEVARNWNLHLAQDPNQSYIRTSHPSF